MYKSAFNWIVICVILAAFATIVLAFLFTSSIVTPLTQAALVAEAVASGDLRKDFVVW